MSSGVEPLFNDSHAEAAPNLSPVSLLITFDEWETSWGRESENLPLVALEMSFLRCSLSETAP